MPVSSAMGPTQPAGGLGTHTVPPAQPPLPLVLVLDEAAVLELLPDTPPPVPELEAEPELDAVVEVVSPPVLAPVERPPAPEPPDALG